MLSLRSAILFAAVGLAGCAVPTVPPEPGIAGAWRIDQARSEPLLDKRHAKIVFERDGTLAGHTSCNVMRSTYALAGDRITIGPVVTTRMACGELQRAQEDRILTALELAATARVRPDGILELRDAEGRGLLRGTRPEAQP